SLSLLPVSASSARSSARKLTPIVAVAGKTAEALVVTLLEATAEDRAIFVAISVASIADLRVPVLAVAAVIEAPAAARVVFPLHAALVEPVSIRTILDLAVVRITLVRPSRARRRRH